MNFEHSRTEGLPSRDVHINITAMATMVQEMVGHNGMFGRDPGNLREQAIAAGLNEHEYGAIRALYSKIEAEGLGFLDDSFSMRAW